MAEAFQHIFFRQLPTTAHQQEQSRYKDLPLLSEVAADAVSAVTGFPEVMDLPAVNQNMLRVMAKYMIHKANSMQSSWGDNRYGNFWGLYLIGSRARGQAEALSDVDILSVGTLKYATGFMERLPAISKEDPVVEEIVDAFALEFPGSLPDEYNIGDVDRKYLIRATPEVGDAVPVDLNVVDLTYTFDSYANDLQRFKDEMDVDATGDPLPRLPLIELTLAPSY